MLLRIAATRFHRCPLLSDTSANINALGLAIMIVDLAARYSDDWIGQFADEDAADQTGIARWWASFLIVPQGLQTKLDGIFVITLDDDGRCKALREWW
jgi:hypothetical protein